MNEQQANKNGNDLPFKAQVKLPRNIRHWAKARGLVISSDYFNDGALYMHSSKREFTKGIVDDRRHFRILGHVNYFQICDGDFDRWANSVGTTLPIPMTRVEFDAAIDELVANAEVPELTVERINGEASRVIKRAEDGIANLEERFGYIVEWANRNGRHGKWVRRSVSCYKRGVAEEKNRVRQANRHRKAKLAELACQKED